jgi:hypothetical protein
MDEQPELVCPTCGRPRPASERFCEACAMPLVRADAGEDDDAETSERRRRARKIKPQYAEGELVVVAGARTQPEAEFIAGLLLEEGIPSVLRDSIAGYAPVIGRREILVPESGAQAAREALSPRPKGS